MAKKYGLEYIAIQGFSPNSEPTAKDMANIINIIKAKNAKYIYFEEIVNPQAANSLSKETGVELLALHGAHNVSKMELENGVTFLEIMNNNLENLRTGLICK
jgi:zinc transport system substrate-binding protein